MGAAKRLMTIMIGSILIPGVLLLAPVDEMSVELRLIDSIPGLIVSADRRSAGSASER
jgi:ABC-type glycerol-3-phosphate transport system permease component